MNSEQFDQHDEETFESVRAARRLVEELVRVTKRDGAPSGAPADDHPFEAIGVPSVAARSSASHASAQLPNVFAVPRNSCAAVVRMADLVLDRTSASATGNGDPVFEKAEVLLFEACIFLLRDWFPEEDCSFEGIARLLDMADTRPGDARYQSALDCLFFQLEQGRIYMPDEESGVFAWQRSRLRRYDGLMAADGRGVLPEDDPALKFYCAFGRYAGNRRGAVIDSCKLRYRGVAALYGVELSPSRASAKPRKASRLKGEGAQGARSAFTRETQGGAAAQNLEDMVGLASVKREFENIRARLEWERKMADAGQAVRSAASHHMAFLGNPGTGKTTVARIAARLLYEMGAIESPHVVERDRGTLVGSKWGQGPENLKEAFEEAAGGVLFIDEAYSLVQGDDDKAGLGGETLAALVKRMEDERESTVVVLAGYEEEMKDLLRMNPGLASRISHTLHFEDFTADELMAILFSFVERDGLALEDAARTLCLDYFGKARKRPLFGNGRFVREFYDRLLETHARNARDASDISTLRLLTERDVLNLVEPGLGQAASGEEELARLVGLTEVKRELLGFKQHLAFQRARLANGVPLGETPGTHMVFEGNPGTGKTTVARLVGKILLESGALSEGHVIEVDRGDLVGSYVGETAKKTKRAISQAAGGVLFVDEAYALCRGSRDTYGMEAVDTLVKAMEDMRDNLTVVFAGYRCEMEDFLQVNPGLASRISYTFTFEDYSTDELVDIFRLMLKRNSFAMEDKALDMVRSDLEEARRQENFGNGRYVRNLFEKVLREHERNCDLADVRALTLITAASVQSVTEEAREARNKAKHPKVGF